MLLLHNEIGVTYLFTSGFGPFLVHRFFFNLSLQQAGSYVFLTAMGPLNYNRLWHQNCLWKNSNSSEYVAINNIRIKKIKLNIKLLNCLPLSSAYDLYPVMALMISLRRLLILLLIFINGTAISQLTLTANPNHHQHIITHIYLYYIFQSGHIRTENFFWSEVNPVNIRLVWRISNHSAELLLLLLLLFAVTHSIHL